MVLFNNRVPLYTEDISLILITETSRKGHLLREMFKRAYIQHGIHSKQLDKGNPLKISTIT